MRGVGIVWTRETAIAYLNDTFQTLSSQTDLSPDNETVTRRLHELVATLADWHSSGFGADLADDPALSEARENLPLLCAEAEHQLEKWWCRKALASDSPADVLAGFWYLPNYISLCGAEAQLAGRDALRDAVFLGCGALPMTAIVLARSDADAHLTCIDADAQACALAAQLVRKLNLDNRIAVHQGRAETWPAAPGARVICASLLDAPGLYDHLAARGVSRLFVRDVDGIYRWLYRPADLPGPEFRERTRTAVSRERINITRCFEPVNRPDGPPATGGADNQVIS